MKILVDRKYKKASYTIGRLYVDGSLVCNTLEDKDRGLSDTMSVEEIKRIKIYAQTAIPCGVYDVKVTYSPKFKRKLPILLNVKGFTGIRIHGGNRAADTAGCILLGENKEVGKVLNSLYYVNKVTDAIQAAIKRGEDVSIEIR